METEVKVFIIPPSTLPAIVRFSGENLPIATAVIHFSSCPFMWGIPLLMQNSSLLLSIRTMWVPSSMLPSWSFSSLIWLWARAQVSERPITSALLLPPPAHPRLSLLGPWCRWQSFPGQPQRWIRWPSPVFITLGLFSKPSSASICISSSVMWRGEPPYIVACGVIMRWRSPVVKLLLVWLTLLYKWLIFCERRGSPLVFLPKDIIVAFMVFSGVVVPLQVCHDFMRVKGWLLPWEPPENVHKNN